MKKGIVTALLVALLVIGCAQKESVGINGTNTTPVNESSQPHYLKDIIIEDDLGNNKTKITVVYEFPSAAYNVTLNSIKVKNSTAILFVEVNKTSEPAAQVITTRNITVTLNYSIDTAMVLTADVE